MGKPYILVVDDDQNVAKLICEHLENQGYRVTYCTDAAQALLQAEGLRIGLLITDIVMPTFGTGIDVYKNLRNHPFLPKNLPIIFLTGLKADQARPLVPLSDPRVRLLHKPTSLQNLMQAIQELTGGNLKPAGS